MKHSHKKSFDWYSMQQRYSIRKYYFGAVSVLLGTALVLGAAASVQTVQAEENKQETTNSISVGRGEAATKPAEVSASNKEKTYAAPTVANPVETTPVKTGEVTKPAEKVEEAKDKKEEVTHQDAIDKSKLLTALSRAKKLESKLYTEASAANLQTSIQAGQSLLGKADASEAELSAAESSIQSSIIGLELRSNSNKGTVSETPVAKKANIVEAKEETKPAVTTTERSAVDSAILPISTAAKVETTSAPASTNEILKPSLSLSDARQNPAIRKEDVDRGYSGFRTAGSGFRAAGSGFRAAGPENKPILNPNNTIAFSDISQGLHSFRGIGHSRGGREIHYDVTTVRRGNRLNFTIKYSGPGEFVNNNFILDKGDGFGNPSNATITSSNPRVREQSKSISQGANYVSHSGYSMTSATSTNTEQTIRFSLPIINPNGDLSVRLKPVTFNVDQGGGGAATSNDPYSNSNYYHRANPLLLDANPYGGTNNKTVSEDIDFQTVYLPTSKLPEGQTRLVREGEKGQRQITYKVHRFGNETLLGLPISNRVTKEAKPRIMQIGVAKELIDTVKPRVDQNKVGDTNNLTFYLDNDGNGVYTEGVDELVQKIAIKDGAKGEKGDQGERGLTGAQGTKGEKGDQGERGLTGAQGTKGEKGDRGERGLTGAQGQAGRDAVTPTVTVKDNKNDGTHTITINDGRGNVASTVVRDGFDGASPLVATQRNEADKTTTVIFYYDQNGNNELDASDKKLKEVIIADGAKGEQGLQGRDGQDGAQGQAGRDGKDVLNGKANPEVNQGKDGDKYVNTETGDVFVKNNGNWDKEGNIKGPKGDKGERGEDGKTPEVTVTPGKDGHSTDITFTVPGKDPVTFTVKDGKNGKDGRAPKIKVEDITSPSRIRRDTDAAATPTRNGIRVTVYDDVNDNGVYDEGVDKVLNSKDIYNGIDGRDGSAPTITTKDNGDGTHTITVQNPDSSESTTVVKDGKDGKTANITTTENPDGSHTITVTNPDGSTKETVVKNGKDGKTPKVEVTDNNDGTHTVKVTDGDGNVTNAIIKDGKDGKAATATTTENPDGSHTVTITNPDGTKNEFVVKNGRDGVDGRTPTASVRDNGDGSHTIVITNPEGVTTETTVRDGKSPKVTITDEQNGTHKISVLNGDGTTTETIIKDGKSPVATVRDNQDGTYTIRVENGNGTVSETTVRDGKSPTAKVVDNGDGTHTITVVNSDGTTTTTTVRDGREPKLEVIDNNDGSHTIKVTGADGKGTTTTIFDGKSPKANIVDNGDGTHTLTIVDSDGREYKSIIKDGKDGKDSVSPTVTVKNNNDGTHVVTITNPDGSKTEMVIKDGKDGKCGCQDKPVTPSNDKPVPPTPNVPTPEVPVKPVPAQPTPNVPTPEVPVQPTPAVPTPEVPVKPVPAVPEQPVVPTPAQPATPVNANPVAPTTGKENRGDKLPETGSQSDYISVLLGSGILLSLYVGRRKED
ncbi:collagen-like surface-anchored protein [Streptococcus pneumoniae]|uniref:pneumococcal collagen-like adhesin PclA n=1 Tax=Streptococcus pneumoniae TaxID=1313 RepID=UPI0005E53961|nr:YSIRK signal domain/LPXTG anchor domain surface protein [Streptococcus pneumoniae]MBW7486893.1 YSIRK signal domain/LPXTG anchor domain surface protein [Streptococcus pneumoniae]CEV53755.1 collagen-like surface-anchored protein [Streptococcus pneumoniae]CJE62139.1 collagen-like surface-anchored protein [Streptococcus pneumoniae]CJN63521.1 collagen-like surface-anchored protein [Streptococcus pneumoniae]COK72618.1 collagen-like surface-anchored protein [Streptococcus pneumoniae]